MIGLDEIWSCCLHVTIPISTMVNSCWISVHDSHSDMHGIASNLPGNPREDITKQSDSMHTMHPCAWSRCLTQVSRTTVKFDIGNIHHIRQHMYFVRNPLSANYSRRKRVSGVSQPSDEHFNSRWRFQERILPRLGWFLCHDAFLSQLRNFVLSKM